MTDNKPLPSVSLVISKILLRLKMEEILARNQLKEVTRTIKPRSEKLIHRVTHTTY